ncbi:MAG: hypothetical protein BGO67_01200 [Alphaproteobacteria bacterium 41-28]|nr:MAG: hypothetical protein BGO67_01200 [Alphaproteobacteria bacterium 41-28]
MNRIVLFSSFLLASSSLLAPTYVSSHSSLIKTPDDLDRCKKKGRTKVVPKRAKRVSTSFRRSDKGDLSNSSNPFDDQRRLFYMLGDEDCFFHSIGLTREQAVILWLDNAWDNEVRGLASDTIYDMFMADFRAGDIDPQNGLPLAMKAKIEYQVFENELRNIINERQVAESSGTFDPFSWDYQELLARERRLNDRIKREYCYASEEVYRDYVNLVLNAGRKSIIVQDGPIGQNGFANALALILRRELSVWNFTEAGDSLVKVYSYRPRGFLNGKWELHEEGARFSRMVKVNDFIGLEDAKRDENIHLKSAKKLIESSLNSKISKRFNRLELARMKALAESDFVPPAEQVEYRRQAEELRNNIPNPDKLLSVDVRAAYYKARIDVLTKETEKLRKEINRTFFIAPHERAAALAGNRILLEKVQGIERAQAEHVANLPRLRTSLESLEREINLYEQLFTPLGVNPTEMSHADALLYITLYYGNLAEEAEKISLDDTKDAATRNRYRELSEQALASKKLYGDRFDELQNKIHRDIDFQVRLHSERAERRLSDNLNRNLMLQGRYSFTNDFHAAQGVLNAALNEMPENAKYFNPSYLSADPFLNSDQPDINEVYPNDISNAEWVALRDQLKADVLYFLLPEARRNLLGDDLGLMPTINSTNDTFIYLNGERVNFLSDEEISREFEGLNRQDLLHAYFGVHSVFERLNIFDNHENMGDQKNQARKRMQRIADKNVADGQREGDEDPSRIKKSRVMTALMAAQTEGRCPDGIFSGFEVIENQLFREGNSTESEISAIFSNYAHHYFQNYANLTSPTMGFFAANEWSTNAPQFAKQRLFFSIFNKGQPRTTFYALPHAVQAEADTIFNPRNLMGIFLRGGEVTYGGRTIRFSAFTAEKAIDFAYEAYLRGLQRAETGHKLTNEHLKTFIDRDPYLEHVYGKYLEDLEEGNPINSAFFESNVPNNNLEFERVFKKAFFEYVLIRLGYVIDPTNTWETKRRRFLEGHLDEFPTEEDAAPTVPAHQPAPVVIQGTVPPPPNGEAPPPPVENWQPPNFQFEYTYYQPVVTQPTPAARKRALRSKKARASAAKKRVSRARKARPVRRSRAAKVRTRRVRVSKSRIQKRVVHRRVARKRVRRRRH